MGLAGLKGSHILFVEPEQRGRLLGASRLEIRQPIFEFAAVLSLALPVPTHHQNTGGCGGLEIVVLILVLVMLPISTRESGRAIKAQEGNDNPTACDHVGPMRIFRGVGYRN